MKIQLSLLTIFSFLTVGLVSAEDIYRCDGIIQNRPCAANQSGRILNNLPPISKVSSADPSFRARPRPEIFEVPKDETNVVTKKNPSAVKGQSSADLALRSSQLMSQVASRAVKLPDAQAEMIRLQVLHDTLCTKSIAGSDMQVNADCEKAQANLQSVTVAVRNANTGM